MKPLYSNGTIHGRVNIQDDTNGPIQVTATGPYGNKTLKLERSPGTSMYEYSFTGLGNGTYQISATKDSFGTVENYNIAVFGTDTVWAPFINLYKMANDPVIPQSPVYESQDVFSLVFNNAPANSRYRLIAFMSTKDDVSYNKYQVYSSVIFENDKKIRITKDRILKPDTRVYIILYACNISDSGYWNNFYNLQLFSSVNPAKHSQIFSAIIK